MLSNFSKESIYSNVLQILCLSREGCPEINFLISPYELLIDFANSLEHATQEEIDYVKEVLETELMGGTYVTNFSKDFNSFEECVTYFFNDDKQNPNIYLEDFLFGEIISKKINDAIAYWSGV